jgi:hypothetical protein
MLGWRSVSPTEAGFADNMEERLDKAVAEKRIWNLHSVIVVRNGRLVLERYFDGEDDARGSRWALFRSNRIRSTICARRPKA